MLDGHVGGLPLVVSMVKLYADEEQSICVSIFDNEQCRLVVGVPSDPHETLDPRLCMMRRIVSREASEDGPYFSPFDGRHHFSFMTNGRQYRTNGRPVQTGR